METDISKSRIEQGIAGIIWVLKWIGALFLALMMFLTAMDVACRYLFNNPISGAMELVEFMMAILIPFSIAYCAFCKSHVAVEFILEKMPTKVQNIVAFPMNLLTILFLLIISWQGVLYTVETYESKLTSSVLLIVAYPFVIPVSIGMAVFAVILLYEMGSDLFSTRKK